ncbi:hypothetical protein ABPG75_009035 [Micractinium tetrahymenae]
MVHPLLDPAAAPPEHCSFNSRVPTAVTFENATQRTVEVMWLNYHGAAHRYHTLPPDGSAVQLTFTAHPWAFRDPADPAAVLVVEGQAVFYAPPQAHGSDRPRAVIREAERQPWGPAHHLHTPPAFQEQAAALLLCHRRLARGGVVLQGAQEQGAQGGWCGRLRGAVSWPRRQQGPDQGRPDGQAGPEEAALPVPAAQQQPGLGDLPQELLLVVLAAAAPTVPILVKPALPQGVSPAELPPGALEQLFRAGGSEEGGGTQANGSGGTSAASGASLRLAVRREEQARRMPAHQLWQLRGQQEDPQPPPLAAVPHPLLGNPAVFVLAAGPGPNPLPGPAPSQPVHDVPEGLFPA